MCCSEVSGDTSDGVVGLGGGQTADGRGRHFGVDFLPWMFLLLLRPFITPAAKSFATLYKVLIVHIPGWSAWI